MRHLMRQARGFTLVEMLVSSLIASVVAGGTMMAYVTAARITRQQNSSNTTEASLFAQETIERFRNRIAARLPTEEVPWPGANVGTWQDDPLPVDGGGSDSILQTPGRATRVYCVMKVDCNGNGTVTDPDDCYGVQVKVCWNGTQCPTPGQDTCQ